MTPAEISAAKKQAFALLAAKRFVEAKNLIGALHQKLPEDPEVSWLVADLFAAEGHLIDAVKFLGHALQTLKNKKLRSQFLERLVDLCSKTALDKDGARFAKEWADRDKKSLKAHFFLGVFLSNRRLYKEAIEAFLRAILLDSKHAWAHIHIAGCYMHMGEADLAREHYKKALKLDRNSLVFPTYYLYSANSMASLSDDYVAQEHIRYGQQLEEKFNPQAHTIPAARPEKLKIAFSGSEFRCHSVTYFLLPLLEKLSLDAYETFCYSDTDLAKEDAYTDELKAKFQHWRAIDGVSSEDVFQQLLNDKIDILIDLNGYTGKFRMDLFAKKAAPVQVSYLGYPNTTGLSRVDYRLTDTWADPEGESDRLNSEKLIRLKNGFLCYQPDRDAFEVGIERSEDKSDQVVFGSFNAFHKLNESVVALWSDILNRVPGSSLFMKNGSLGDEAIRNKVYQWFEKYGVDRARVEMENHTETKAEHFALYKKVDLHLDTFPYNGTTTTCEALWQGVPTLCYEGESHRSRVGVSIMCQVGLEDFVAKDRDHYVQLAVDKARDKRALKSLREGMRERMQASPLMNKALFAEEFSEALESMYQAFLNSGA